MSSLKDFRPRIVSFVVSLELCALWRSQFHSIATQGDVLTRVNNVRVTSVKQARRLMKKVKDTNR